jgi:hypothetical protein
MKKLQTTNYKLLTPQRGQSLIETIAAIFILTSTLAAGIGLTIYAHTNTRISQNEIVASNLAREGVEVVRAMRDSNWLASDAKGGQWDLQACSDIGGRLCYPRVTQQAPPYTHYNLSSGNHRLIFNSSDQSWTLGNPPNYDLYLQADGTYAHTINGVSTFARMIDITFNSAAPYTNQNSNQEMIVKSVVAWRGKGCTAFTTNQDLLTLSTPCKIVAEEHMTNWKDYK